MKKDQERHARYKEDDKLRKWAAKKKKKGANDQKVANVEEVANVELICKKIEEDLARN